MIFLISFLTISEIIFLISGSFLIRSGKYALIAISNAYLGISSERESGASYAWNMKTDGTPGAVAWKITKRSSSTDQSKNYDDLYYCLNAEQGFGIANGEMAEGKIDYYDYSTEMNVNSKELIASKVNNKTELSENYNKILWILDNSYMPTREDSYKSSLEYKNLMNKIGVEIENDDKEFISIESYAICK